MPLWNAQSEQNSSYLEVRVVWLRYHILTLLIQLSLRYQCLCRFTSLVPWFSYNRIDGSNLGSRDCEMLTTVFPHNRTLELLSYVNYLLLHAMLFLVLLNPYIRAIYMSFVRKLPCLCKPSLQARQDPHWRCRLRCHHWWPQSQPRMWNQETRVHFISTIYSTHVLKLISYGLSVMTACWVVRLLMVVWKKSVNLCEQIYWRPYSKFILLV